MNRMSTYFTITVLTFASPLVMAAQNSANTESNVKMNETTQRMTAIDIIEKDHAAIRQMFSSIDNNLNDKFEMAQSQFNDLKNFLIKHETMEQKAWYPELEKYKELGPIIANLKKEEQTAGDELGKIGDIKNKQEWIAKFKKLQKDVDNHARNEETILFPKVKQTVDKSSLEAIAQKLEAFKNKS